MVFKIPKDIISSPFLCVLLLRRLLWDLCSYRPVVLSLSDFRWPGILFLLLCTRVNTQKSNQMKIVSTQSRNPDKKVDLKKKKVYLEVRGLDSPREIINRKND